MEREKRLMRHFQDSVQTLTDVANALRENTQKQVSDMGQMVSSNYQELSLTMET